MWQILSSLLSNVKIWLYGVRAAIIIVFIVIFSLRGHEIDVLNQRIKIDQVNLQQSQQTIDAMNKLRDKERKENVRIQQRIQEIQKTLPKDDGPVAPVLHQSLQRL